MDKEAKVNATYVEAWNMDNYKELYPKNLYDIKDYKVKIAILEYIETMDGNLFTNIEDHNCTQKELLEFEFLLEFLDVKRMAQDREEREWINQVIKDDAEMVNELKDTDFAKNAKSRFIKSQQEAILREFKATKDPSKKMALKEELQRYENIKNAVVTDDMIVRARSYPIGKIIKINKSNFSHCIAHDDKTPSMNCNKNFAYCHSCGYTGDTIDVYMRVNDAGFKQAVIDMSA